MKILVCYDGSQQSQKALQLAEKNARLWEARVIVAQAVERTDPLSHDILEKKERQFIKEAKGLAGDDGLDINYEFLVDSLPPGQQFVNFAKTQNIDYIFIGIVKRSKVGKLMFGSTAQQIILTAPCPVLSVN